LSPTIYKMSASDDLTSTRWTLDCFQHLLIFEDFLTGMLFFTLFPEEMFYLPLSYSLASFCCDSPHGEESQNFFGKTFPKLDLVCFQLALDK
jgi:hypothetical protein